MKSFGVAGGVEVPYEAPDRVSGAIGRGPESTRTGGVRDIFSLQDLVLWCEPIVYGTGMDIPSKTAHQKLLACPRISLACKLGLFCPM